MIDYTRYDPIRLPEIHRKNRIFLLETHIAGVSYVSNQDIFPKLSPGSELCMVREPRNEYDRSAIMLETKKGTKVGYIPRKGNTVLARLMDAGKILFCIVFSNGYTDNCKEIRIWIFMEDGSDYNEWDLIIE